FQSPCLSLYTGNIEAGYFLDVKRCPVAELMAANHASELCVQTWCGVDFGLVEIIGGTLQREGTLAMGRDKCDFVFLPESQ
ncbi:MAG: L-2-amino-thiazoline-4-carboxylic acid hydrolase, partial [Chloroflexi bacterium]|nr:L-2-amino-thiazoline-4-carboxylic acid hydrolase [Chloroflexota bacterium]